MKPKHSYFSTIGVFICTFIALMLWIGWLFQDRILQELNVHWNVVERGQWGDTFGALNALFSAFAFIGVVVTLIWQQRQIRLAQVDQHKQRFESSYFELVRMLNQARDSVSFRHSSEYVNENASESSTRFARSRLLTTHSGVPAFKAAWLEAYFFIRAEGRNPSKEVVAATYVIRIHDRHETSFSPYFRLLYTILDRIQKDEIISNQEKVRYGNLLRSQITSYELAICALNGLSEVSNKFDNLLLDFRLLKYMPRGNRRELLEKYYHPDTFKARE